MRREWPQPDTFTFTHIFDVESDKTQTEAKLQARVELASPSQSVVSQTFTELGDMLSVPI